MQTPDRDRCIIEHILRYCDEIEMAHNDFGRSLERLRSSRTYLNAVSMCILQIGELAGRLTGDFTQSHPEQPWRQIKGMRKILTLRRFGIH